MAATERRRARQPATARHATAAPHGASLRFFVVDHPTKLKDKHQMTQNRKHVMLDYLSKERLNPGSTDVRVTGSSTGKKRKRPESVTPGTSNATPQRSLTTDRRIGPRALSSTPSPLATDDTITTNDSYAPVKIDTAPWRPVTFVEDLSPLINGHSGHSQYLRMSLESIPNPIASVGSGFNPFDTWPRILSPHVNVEHLKWNCSRYFGTKPMTAHWIPTLLKAKHAFLSTLCISSSHEDIMRRGLQQPHERHPSGSIERWTVRGEVISMINDAMRDPEMRSTDATIVAVLHLLNSEMMGCDGSTMAVHQRGLHNMINERGGLSHLGVDGQLASILTITMYMISTLRETEPHSDFIRYAKGMNTLPPTHQRTIPESPVFCRPVGFITLRRAVPSDSPILELLEDLRALTNTFITTSTPSLGNSAETQADIQRYHDRISALQPAKDRPHDFASTRDETKFEALRLVAQVYAHALHHQVPFSKAASELASQHDGTSWHIQIKHCLIRTDISDCWGHLAGVLWWMALVAGAGANPDSPYNKLRRELSSEEEESRKWLAAIAVRCSIVLSFEYGAATLQSLKVMVGIEQALARLDADREGRGVQRIAIGGMPIQDAPPCVFGPAEIPLPQRTFQDFAQDFLQDC